MTLYNQSLATDVESVDLTSAKAYLTTVKGYLSEKKNGWGNDRPLTSGELKSKKAGNTLEFNTQFNGNAAVFIYRNPTAALTVNIYSGTTMGDASKNPPSTCDVPKDSFDWTLAETYDKEIDASKEDEEKRTFRVKEFRTLKEMGADKTASSELYGFIKDFTDADDPDGVIKSGPPKDDTKDGDNYVTTAVWEKDSKSHVVLNLYYVRFLNGGNTPGDPPDTPGNPPTPTPKVTPTPPPDGGDGDHTQVTWDDIPNGMGSEWKEHGSGPLIETKSSNCKIEGVVEKDEVETVMDSKGVLKYGLEGETIIPNGYRDWDNGGKYHANKLKSEIRNTAYLSRGGIKKHNKSYSFTVHMSRTIVFVIPPSTPFGSPSYVSRLQKVDMGVTVKTVYFELLRAEVWEPTKAKTFNYAFPNSTTGDNVKIDVDGECRVPVKQLFAAAGKDYFVKLAKQAPDWGDVGKAENWWHKYEVNTAALSNLFYTLPTIEIGVGSYDDIPESVDGIRLDDFVRFLANVTPGIVESNFKVASDVLEFIHPNWEVGKAGQKDVILWKTMYGHKATGPFGTLYIGPENYDKLNALNNLRIPLSKMSTDGLFKVSGIRVDQSKLNSKLVQDGPDNASRVAVRYSITPMCLGSGSPANGWFYSNTCHKVTLHTPVALNVKIKKYTRERVQSQRMFTEDDGEPLTLGTPFEIELTYKGDFDNVDYGKKLDTRPYLMEDDTAYFTFPFPVFVKDKSEKVEYHEKDIQFKQTDVSKCKFYAAYWALEDRHVFTTDVDALNAVGQDKMKETWNMQKRIELLANSCRDNYRAEFLKQCNTIGILTDLRITDIGDYPLLQKIFRKGENTYEKTGFELHCGENNFVGQKFTSDKNTTYPVVNGDRLREVQYGAFKTGYKIRFNVNTISSLFSQNDLLHIEPTYYWIPKATLLNPTPQAQKVQIYYDEAFNGGEHKLVPVGSALDSSNVHRACIADKEYNVNHNDLVDSAERQGYPSVKELLQKVESAWVYPQMYIRSNMKVSEGLRHKDVLAYASDGTRLGFGTVDDKRLSNCLQDWYCEFYFPNTIHVRTVTDDDNRAFKRDGLSGYDFNEPYWCKDGYLLVNFNIETLKGGNIPHLKYDASHCDTGYCNMWNVEKRRTSHYDNRFQKFDFVDGDFAIFDLSKCMQGDYKSGGTH